MPARLPWFVLLWFALDGALALLPVLHWSLGGAGTILGLPRALVYLVATNVLIAASVVTAYLADPSREGRA